MFVHYYAFRRRKWKKYLPCELWRWTLRNDPILRWVVYQLFFRVPSSQFLHSCLASCLEWVLILTCCNNQLLAVKCLCNIMHLGGESGRSICTANYGDERWGMALHYVGLHISSYSGFCPADLGTRVWHHAWSECSVGVVAFSKRICEVSK